MLYTCLMLLLSMINLDLWLFCISLKLNSDGHLIILIYQNYESLLKKSFVVFETVYNHNACKILDQ